MSMKTRQKHWLYLFMRGVFLVAMAVLIAVPQTALAQPAETPEETNIDPKAPKLDYSAIDNNYYSPFGNNVCGGDGALQGGDTLTKFLQALAHQESSGNPKAVSPDKAKGKYQYIDDTWHSHAKKYYPPADKFADALAAPEEVQDALAYIEYAAKFKQYNGDLEKLALSHFFPAALTNPSLLDVIPAGTSNVLTPRQYAQAFIQRVNSGIGKEIPIKATQAPQFAEFLAKVGGEGGTAGAIDCSSGGVVAGDIVKTALGLAWPRMYKAGGVAYGPNKSDARQGYQDAMPKFNPTSAAAPVSSYPWSDCGVFVATVISASADPNYQKRGTSSQIAYMQAHPEKYNFFTSSDYVNSSSKLQPGDIMINHQHTIVFTGPYEGEDGKMYNAADASWHQPQNGWIGHVPQAQNWGPGFYIGRVKK